MKFYAEFVKPQCKPKSDTLNTVKAVCLCQSQKNRMWIVWTAEWMKKSEFEEGFTLNRVCVFEHDDMTSQSSSLASLFHKYTSINTITFYHVAHIYCYWAIYEMGLNGTLNKVFFYFCYSGHVKDHVLLLLLL